GDAVGEAEVRIDERIAWQVDRHFGRYGHFDDEGRFITPYANSRQVVSWVMGMGEHAQLTGPAELVDELAERVELLEARHTGDPELADVLPPSAPLSNGQAPEEPVDETERREAAIRPE